MPTVMTDAATVVIRRATAADTDQLVRIAGRDSQRPIEAPALIAEVDGVAHAALEIADGRVIADPFVPTADLVALLRLRAQAVGRGSAVGARMPRLSTYLAPGFDGSSPSSNRSARLPRTSTTRLPHDGVVARRRRRLVLLHRLDGARPLVPLEPMDWGSLRPTILVAGRLLPGERCHVQPGRGTAVKVAGPPCRTA